ncbi:MAG: WecB/TagA/CpsF family glycosyltransferase [Planctomycetota bacterium]
MIDQGKHNVLGVKIDAVDYDGAIHRVMTAADQGRPMAVSALAVHGLMTGSMDPTHRYRLNRFDLLCPDGQPVRWALGWVHGAKLPDRVYGPNLMLKLCQRAAETGTPIFLFGGSEELLADLSTRLLEKFPDLPIAGTRASKFRTITADERHELVEEVRASGAKMCFVGLGCPRQEVFAYEMREALGMPLLAVGAAFNFHAQRLSQAPKWMQDRGLEWFYRLMKEPRRLWRRYLMLNPMYLTLLGLQATGLHTRSPEGEEPMTEVCYG